MSDLTPKEIAALSIGLRCGASRNRLIETVGGMQHYVSNLKAAQAIKQLQATIIELENEVNDAERERPVLQTTIRKQQATITELEAELDKMWKLVDYSGLSVDEAMTVLAQMKEIE